MENDNPNLRPFARRMRREPTPAEKALWKLLRDRRLAGFKFRRQVPFGPYILDYYCARVRLVIEPMATRTRRPRGKRAITDATPSSRKTESSFCASGTARSATTKKRYSTAL